MRDINGDAVDESRGFNYPPPSIALQQPTAASAAALAAPPKYGSLLASFAPSLFSATPSASALSGQRRGRDDDEQTQHPPKRTTAPARGGYAAMLASFAPSFPLGGSTFSSTAPAAPPPAPPPRVLSGPVLQPHVLHHPPARAPAPPPTMLNLEGGNVVLQQAGYAAAAATMPRHGPPPLGPSQPGPGSSPSSSDGGIGTIGSMGGDESFKGSEQGGFYGGDESFSKKPDDYQSSTLMNENEDENTEDDFEEFARAVLLGNPGPSPPTSPPWALAGIAAAAAATKRSSTASGRSVSLTGLLKSPTFQTVLVLASYLIATHHFHWRLAPGYHLSFLISISVVLAMLMAGPRLATRICWAGVIGFVGIMICARALLLTPQELSDGLDRTEKSLHGIGLFALVLGAWLGAQPEEYLGLKMRTLAMRSYSLLRVSGLLTMAYRTGRLATIAHIFSWVDVPFSLSVLATVAIVQQSGAGGEVKMMKGMVCRNSGAAAA